MKSFIDWKILYADFNSSVVLLYVDAARQFEARSLEARYLEAIAWSFLKIE